MLLLRKTFLRFTMHVDCTQFLYNLSYIYFGVEGRISALSV